MKGICVGTAVALCMSMGVQARPMIAGDAPGDCTQAESAPSPRPPDVPAGAEGFRGTVVLVISLDRCGRASAVNVEKSSGQKLLDDAAAAAAWTWHLNPEIADGVAVASKVRVPVEFNPDVAGPDPKATSRSRPRDQYFVQRRTQQAKLPTRGKDGKLPGFVPDAFPIGVANIQQALAMLDTYGERRPDPTPVVRQYDIMDEEGVSFWYVIDDPTLDGRAVYRQRAVSDGAHGFWVISSLCQPETSTMCTDFAKSLAGMPPQPDMPPPPPAPPPKPGN